MISERILTLDISTKTGYSLLVSNSDGSFLLEDYGQIPKIECPEGPRYPESYVEWAQLVYTEIENLLDKYAPDVLAIEETTAGSKSSHSQKILEWIHHNVAKLIKETGIKCCYLLTGEWRREVGSYMNDKEKKRNKEVRKYKEKNGTKLARDINNKVMGTVTRKHVSVRRANEVFGLNLTIGENDTADALLIGYSYHLRRQRGLHV